MMNDEDMRDADKDGVDLLEALMLAVEAVIIVDSAVGKGEDVGISDCEEKTPEELAAVIYQMERALAAFRGED